MTHPFHAHLDECERCRTQPFNLCAEGAAKLTATVANHPTPASMGWTRASVSEIPNTSPDPARFSEPAQ